MPQCPTSKTSVAPSHEPCTPQVFGRPSLHFVPPAERLVFSWALSLLSSHMHMIREQAVVSPPSKPREARGLDVK